jgi:hypothetical protein
VEIEEGCESGIHFLGKLRDTAYGISLVLHDVVRPRLNSMGGLRPKAPWSENLRASKFVGHGA